MGAWDCDPFGNDTAGDWTYGLEKVSDLSLIKETIHKIHANGGAYLDGSAAEEAIAAADTLARLKGKFYIRDAYTETVDLWVEKYKLLPPQELIDSAILSLDRILKEPSELLELWEESEDFENWKTHLTDLQERLRTD